LAELDTLLRRAKAALGKRRPHDAAPLIEEAAGITQDLRQKADLLAWLGAHDAAKGENDRAIARFQEAAEQDPQNPSYPFEEGLVLYRQGAREDAADAFLRALHRGSRNARHYLFAGLLLHQTDRQEDALQVWSLGDGIDPMLRQAKNHPDADAETREASALADTMLRRHFSTLHRRASSAASARVREAVWAQTHDADFRYVTEDQRPYFFYMPALKAVPVFARQELEWAEALESHAGAIRQDYLEAAQEGFAAKPYVHGQSSLGAQWDALKGTKNWQSIHLYKDGVLQEGAEAAFARTIEALQDVPLVRVDGEPLEVFFSALAPGAHIPPHFGLSNCRMTVHLPLIIPDGCGIRISDEEKHWAEGEVLAFDDSFEHEAWNRGESTRVVLIFEAWNPDLSEDERAAISDSFAARLGWLRQRKLPPVT
jgi:tetratricopeptide (TPR) repeat protein